MSHDPQRHHRRSIRLQEYDYTTSGAYFVTVVTHERECLFGEMEDGGMRVNEYGEIARAEWFQTAALRPYVVLHPDEFVVMPNHIHGIIWIVGENDDMGAYRGAHRRGTAAPCPYNSAPPCSYDHIERFGKPVPGSIPTIVRAFKSATTRRINEIRGTPGARVWQRNYYEHIVRNDADLQRIREYILTNPIRWAMDRENPTRTP